MTIRPIDQHVYKNTHTKRDPFAIKWLVFCVFVVVYLMLALPNVRDISYALYSLIPVTLALWFGPLRLIDSNSSSRWFDPATLFNTSVFYYSLKGVGLGWGNNTIYLKYMTGEDIRAIYPRVVLYLTCGLLAWNLGYAMLKISKEGVPEKLPVVDRNANYSRQVVFLLLIGMISAFVFFSSFEEGILVFFNSSWKRGYISDPTISGSISAYAQLLMQGFYLIPLSALVWLLSLRKLNRIWWLVWAMYCVGTLVLLVLTAPRAVLLGYILSGLVVFHFVIKPIKSTWLFLLGSLGFLYAFFVQKWRFASVSTETSSVRDFLSLVAEGFTANEFVDFVVSTALIDIRLLVLIVHTYGNELPLKYGATLQMIVGQFIPRAFWPGKPFNVGVEIARLSRPGTISGAPPGYFGEMYLNFHFVGILLGGLLLGLLMGFVYKRLVLSENTTLISILVYAILVQRITLIVSNQISIAVMTVAIQIVMVLFSFWITRSKPLPMAAVLIEPVVATVVGSSQRRTVS